MFSLSRLNRNIGSAFATMTMACCAVIFAAPPTSFAPVVPKDTFEDVKKWMSVEKDDLGKRQLKLLDERYDLKDQTADGVTMARKKPVQSGNRVKLPKGQSWEKLADTSAKKIVEEQLWPEGFFPLPHPNHPEGGMLFPKQMITEVKRLESRDLTRFDLDFDLPEHLLPEFPPPIYLTTRPDLGDVSRRSDRRSDTQSGAGRKSLRGGDRHIERLRCNGRKAGCLSFT